MHSYNEALYEEKPTTALKNMVNFLIIVPIERNHVLNMADKALIQIKFKAGRANCCIEHRDSSHIRRNREGERMGC